MTTTTLLRRLLTDALFVVIIGTSWLISQGVSAQTTYILSDTNAITCPAGSVPVDTPEECALAAAAVGLDYNGESAAIINPQLSAACLNDVTYNIFNFYRAESDFGYSINYKIVCKVGEYLMT